MSQQPYDIYQHDGLKYLGLDQSTAPLSVDNLALIVGRLYDALIDEKTKREDLQEDLLSLSTNINKSIKPLLNKLEDDLELLQEEIGEVSVALRKSKDSHAMTAKEVDVLFNRADKFDATVSTLKTHMSSVKQDLELVNQKVEALSNTQQAQIVINNNSNDNGNNNNNNNQSDYTTNTTQLPTPESIISPTQQPITLPISDVITNQTPVVTSTPARKVYIPKSQRGLATPGSTTATTTSIPSTPNPTSQSATTPGGNRAGITPAGKNMLTRLLTTSTKQQLNPSLSNEGDNAHDRVDRGERLGRTFYTRTKLLQYKPSVIDSLEYINRPDFQKQRPIVPNPDTTLATKPLNTTSQNPEDDSMSNLPEDLDNNNNNNNNNNTITSAINYKDRVPFAVYGLPNYLRSQDNPNIEFWLGTHRDATKSLSITTSQQHNQQQQYASRYHTARQQPQQSLKDVQDKNEFNYDDSDPNWAPKEKWSKAIDDELLFLEWKRERLLQQRQQQSNGGSSSNFGQMSKYRPLHDGNRYNNTSRGSNNNNNNNTFNNINTNNNQQLQDNDNDNAFNWRDGPRSFGSVPPPPSEPQYDYWGELIEYDPQKYIESIENKKKASSWVKRLQEQEEQDRIKSLRQEYDLRNEQINAQLKKNSNNDDDEETEILDGANNDNSNIISQRIEYLQNTILNVQSKLNKLTTTKVEQFASEIATLLLNNNKHIDGSYADELQLAVIVHVILNRATKEPSMVALYAKLIQLMLAIPGMSTANFHSTEKNNNIFPSSSQKNNNDIQSNFNLPPYYYGKLSTNVILSFKRAILIYSEFLLTNYTKSKTLRDTNPDFDPNIEFLQDPDKAPVLPNGFITAPIAKPIVLSTPVQGRTLCKFLGEMYKLSLFPPQAIDMMLGVLLDTHDEDDVIVVVDFMTSILPTLKQQKQQTQGTTKPTTPPFNGMKYIMLLQDIAKTERLTRIEQHTKQTITTNVQKRTKFLIMDFLDKYMGKKK